MRVDWCVSSFVVSYQGASLTMRLLSRVIKLLGLECGHQPHTQGRGARSMKRTQPPAGLRGPDARYLDIGLRATWSTWSAVGNLTSRAKERI